MGGRQGGQHGGGHGDWHGGWHGGWQTVERKQIKISNQMRKNSSNLAIK